MVVVAQGAEQLWEEHGAHNGSGGECAIHRTGWPLRAADWDIHGNAPCRGHRCSHASQV